MAPRRCARAALSAAIAAGLVVGGACGQLAWETLLPQHENGDFLDVRPRTRYSHSATVVGDEIVVAFGYFYNHSSRTPTWLAEAWALSEKPSPTRAEWNLIWDGARTYGPPPRTNHGAAAAPGRRSLIVFGGSGTNDQKLNDLWELDTASGAWTHLRPKGVVPPPRNCFSAVVIGSSLVVYGGYHLGDLWKYSLPKNRWKRLMDVPAQDSNTHPGKRAGHSAVVHGTDMYVYGGLRFPGDVSDPERTPHGKLPDLWRYSSTENTWELLPQAQSMGGRQYFAMDVVTDWAVHGGSSGQTRLVTMGGVQCAPNCSLVGSVAAYSIEDGQWHSVDVDEEPIPVYQHSMVLYKGALWLFGGESYKPYMYHNSVLRLALPLQRDAAEL